MMRFREWTVLAFPVPLIAAKGGATIFPPGLQVRCAQEKANAERIRRSANEQQS